MLAVQDVNTLWTGVVFHNFAHSSDTNGQSMWIAVAYRNASNAVFNRATRCAVAGSSAIMDAARSRLWITVE